MKQLESMVLLGPGTDPGFSERGSEHRGVSLKQGSGGHSPPEAIRFLLLQH